MLQKIIENISDWLEDRVRSIIRPLSPDGRVILIVTMLVLFSGLSIYMVVSSIYNFGKDKGREIEIRRIETLRLEPEQELEQENRDSINKPLNEFEYGQATEE